MNYSNMVPGDLVRAVIGDRSLCPCLLIGKYVSVFKQIYPGNIERAYTLEEVRHLVEEYDDISSINSDMLVIEGIGSLSDVGQNALLKFIEESRIPLIFLSYSDKISSIILSRMRNVFKLWDPVGSLNFLKVSDAIRVINERKKDGDMKGYGELQFMADNCPTLYSLRQRAGDPYGYSNQRMIDIMCTKVNTKVGSNNA